MTPWPNIPAREGRMQLTKGRLFLHLFPAWNVSLIAARAQRVGKAAQFRAFKWKTTGF